MIFLLLGTGAALFLCGSILFSAAETALFSIPRERLALFKNSRSHRRRWIFALLQDGQKTLLAILLGNLFVNITLVGFIHAIVHRIFTIGTSIITLGVATALIVLVGEIIPKNIALGRNEQLAGLVSPLLFHLKLLCRPLLDLLYAINRFFLNRIRALIKKPTPYVTAPELSSRVTEL
ncbi:MAG: DUF21 domain-containing protein, partial [Chitinivibrionales bacterium]|nr:DUF21 domain-containing protein [Chitinivibrionales bacterium]